MFLLIFLEAMLLKASRSTSVKGGRRGSISIFRKLHYKGNIYGSAVNENVIYKQTGRQKSLKQCRVLKITIFLRKHVPYSNKN